MTKYIYSISRIKLQGKVTKTKARDETCDRTTAELMFYHGIAHTYQI